MGKFPHLSTGGRCKRAKVTTRREHVEGVGRLKAKQRLLVRDWRLGPVTTTATTMTRRTTSYTHTLGGRELLPCRCCRGACTRPPYTHTHAHAHLNFSRRTNTGRTKTIHCRDGFGQRGSHDLEPTATGWMRSLHTAWVPVPLSGVAVWRAPVLACRFNLIVWDPAAECQQ